MIAAALLVLLLAPGSAEEASFREIRKLFEAAAPEPEPPPGLRAPPETERHRRAAGIYARALETWETAERKRRANLVELCSKHLERFAEGERAGDVRYLRGVTRFEAGDAPGARADLEAYLAGDPSGPAAGAAREALVQACRMQGDFEGALRHGGPRPDLLEEAGRVDRAIAAAEAQGDRAKAARWRLIGKPFAGKVKIPQGMPATVVQVGRRLPPERVAGLKRAFRPEKLAIIWLFKGEEAIYLVDTKGIVRAVDPRLDTLHHRIRRLADRR